VETLLQVAVVAGGLVFSFAVALLIEELVFGQIFRAVFGNREVAVPVGTTTTEHHR
jgi:hypothetical protein